MDQLSDAKVSEEVPLNDARLLRLSPSDNVFVLRRKILADEKIMVDGRSVKFDREIGLGHKIAAQPISSGEKVIKYGAPIGSAFRNIALGEHVHTHNIKSNYTATHTLEAAQKRHENPMPAGEEKSS